MKKLTVFAVALLAAASLRAASPAATQEWTRNYVATNAAELAMRTEVTHTNDYTYVKLATGLTFVIEPHSVYSLRATDATAAAIAAGVTNGMYFVWNGGIHSYTNQMQTIEATKTNFAWNGVQSVGCVFSNYFGVAGVKLQPSVAEEVTK